MTASRPPVESDALVRRVFRNTSWLTFEHALRMAVGLVVGIAIARYLGPAQFGLYALLMSLVAIAGALSPLAADSVVTRELIADFDSRHEILGSQAWLRCVGALIALLTVLVVFVLMQSQKRYALGLALLAGLSLLSQPAEAVTAWFQSQLRAGAIVAAKSSAFLALSAVRLGLVALGASLTAFVASAGVEALLAAAGLLLAYALSGERLASWRVSRTRVRQLLRDSWPLLLSGVTSMLYLRLDIVMLGAMRGEVDAGIYGVATRLSEVWYFVPMALAASLQPVILKTRAADRVLYIERLKLLYSAFAWTGIAIALAVAWLASPIVTLLFGAAYAAAGPVLALHVWAGIAVFLGVASSQFLVAENLVKLSLYRTALGLAVNVVLNLALIPSYGPMGAALATLLSYFVATFSLVFFGPSRQQAALMMRALTPAALQDLWRLTALLKAP